MRKVRIIGRKDCCGDPILLQGFRMRRRRNSKGEETK